MERERNGSSVREGGEGSVSAFFKRKGAVTHPIKKVNKYTFLSKLNFKSILKYNYTIYNTCIIEIKIMHLKLNGINIFFLIYYLIIHI